MLLALGAQAQPAFTVVPLGTKGGLAEGNLSAYLVAAAGTNSYVALDAGSLRPGAEKAVCLAPHQPWLRGKRFLGAHSVSNSAQATG